MNTFTGFPARMEFTPIPNPFLNQVMPELGDLVELKIALHALYVLYHKKGYPKYLTLSELLESPGVIKSLGVGGKEAMEKLREKMDMASRQEVFIRLTVQEDERDINLYLLNDERGRMAADQIRTGKIALSGVQVRGVSASHPEDTPNIFTLYEENIGLLTPLISQELSAAEKVYPAGWIEEAIKEAVRRNRRSWRYIARILENWATYGKDNATTEPYYSKQDPSRYTRGQYGRAVRH